MHISNSLLSTILLLMERYVNYAESQVRSALSDKDNEDSVMPSTIYVTSLNTTLYSNLININGTWIGKGLAFKILDIVSLKLNFTYIIVPPKENIIGTERSGVMRLVFEKEVDMVATFLPAIPSILRYCELSTILQDIQIAGLMKKMELSSSGRGILAPFDGTVWLLICASMLIFGPLIYFITRIRAKLLHDVETESFSLLHCYWFVYSSFIKQGTRISAKVDATRLLFVTWWIFIMILNSFYTANLTAFLTKPVFPSKWLSLRQMFEKDRNRWLVLNDSLIYHVIGTINSINNSKILFWPAKHPAQDILNYVDKGNKFLSDDLHINSKLYAYYLEEDSSFVGPFKDSCPYTVYKPPINIMRYAFAFPRNSTIKKKINLVLQRLVDIGMVRYILQSESLLSEICPFWFKPKKKQLSNNDFSLLYAVLLVGYGIAVMLLILEIILPFAFNRLKTRRMKVNGSKTVGWNNGKFRVGQKILIGNKNRPPSLKTDSKNEENNLRLKKTYYVNGRPYYVVSYGEGVERLIPARGLSALYFQKYCPDN